MSAPAFCPACAQAQSNPRTGHFHAGCPECEARALAASPQFFNAARESGFTKDYRDLLERVFHENWQAGHARVKAWARLMAECRAKGVSSQLAQDVTGCG